MTEGVLSGNWNAWADIVIRIWRQKMAKYMIGMYRAKRTTPSHESLFESFERHILNATNGDQQQIDFLFKEYGIFVDMGVGRETSRANPGDVKTKRRRKEWYSKVWFSEVMKLREHMAKQVGEAAANRIMFGLQTTVNASMASPYDAKYGAYREKDLARSAANYRKNNIIL